MDKITGIYYKRSWVQAPAASETMGKETLLHELRLLLDGDQAIYESTYQRDADARPTMTKGITSIARFNAIDSVIPREVFDPSWIARNFGKLVSPDAKLVARIVLQKQYGDGGIQGPAVLCLEYPKHWGSIPPEIRFMEAILEQTRTGQFFAEKDQKCSCSLIDH
jgi:hypothetical protein